VYAAKGIIQSPVTTAATDCSAPDWSMLHYIVKNPPTHWHAAFEHLLLSTSSPSLLARLNIV